MRIIEAGFTILPTPHTQAEILKHIERCGRVCYKSEDKITEDSAQQFVTNIIKRGHEAVLEHGSLCYRLHGAFYLAPIINWYFRRTQDLQKAMRRSFSKTSGWRKAGRPATVRQAKRLPIPRRFTFSTAMPAARNGGFPTMGAICSAPERCRNQRTRGRSIACRLSCGARRRVRV